MVAITQTQTLALYSFISKLHSSSVLVPPRFLGFICLCFASPAASETFAYSCRFLAPQPHSFSFLFSLYPLYGHWPGWAPLSYLCRAYFSISPHLCPCPSHVSISCRRSAGAEDSLLRVTLADQPLQPVLTVLILCSEGIYWKASGWELCSQRAWVPILALGYLALLTFSFLICKMGVVLLTPVMKNKWDNVLKNVSYLYTTIYILKMLSSLCSLCLSP